MGKRLPFSALSVWGEELPFLISSNIFQFLGKNSSKVDLHAGFFCMLLSTDAQGLEIYCDLPGICHLVLSIIFIPIEIVIIFGTCRPKVKTVYHM